MGQEQSRLNILPRQLVPYVAAIGAVGVAAIVATFVVARAEPAIFPLFFLAIVAVAIFGHTRGAICALLLAGALAYFALLSEETTRRQLRVGLFLVVSGITIALVDRMRKSERRQREMARILDEVGQAVIVTDAAGKVIYSNRFATALYGWNAAEIRGRDILDVAVPDIARERAAGIMADLQRGESWSGEFPVKRRDGSVFHAQVTDTPLLDDDGRLTAIIGIARDATERIRLQEQLRESERRFRHMLANVQLISIMLDHEARVTYCNDHLLHLTGWQRHEVLGRSWFEIFIPADLAAELRTVWAQLMENQPPAWHHENEILTRSGERRLIRWNNSVLRGPAGNVIGTASIGEDITKRKEAEEALRELSRRLLAAENLERGRIAKELHDSTAQTLVAAMMSLEVTRKGLAERQPEEATHLEDCLALLESATHEIRTLAYVLHPARLEDEGLVGALHHYADGFGERTDIAMSVELPPNFGRLPSDVELVFFRLVQEALGNVLRHAQAKSATIRLRRTAAEVVLEIADSGRGIPGGAEAVRVGLGIAGMRERMRQIGGHLVLESGAGGTTVRAILPLEKNHA